MRDTLVNDNVPQTLIFLLLGCVPADAVTPLVAHLANVGFEGVYSNSLTNKMRVFDELQVEAVEVCEDIDALHFDVVRVVDEHKVGVNLPAAILTNRNGYIVSLVLRMYVHAGNGSESQQW